MAYLNKDKLNRAEDVVSGKRSFGSESVESRALALGIEAGLKKEELADFVYSKLGGAKTEEFEEKKSKGKELKTGIIKEEVSGEEVEEIGKLKKLVRRRHLKNK